MQWQANKNNSNLRKLIVRNERNRIILVHHWLWTVFFFIILVAFCKYLQNWAKLTAHRL